MPAETHRMPGSACKVCGMLLDAATGDPYDKKKRGPTPGAVSICIGCTNIMIFDEQLQLREPTQEEKHEIIKHARLQDFLKAIVTTPIPKQTLAKHPDLPALRHQVIEERDNTW